MRICLYCIVTLLRGKDPKKGFNDMDYLVFTSITTYPEEEIFFMIVLWLLLLLFQKSRKSSWR